MGKGPRAASKPPVAETIVMPGARDRQANAAKGGDSVSPLSPKAEARLAEFDPCQGHLRLARYQQEQAQDNALLRDIGAQQQRLNGAREQVTIRMVERGGRMKELTEIVGPVPPAAAKAAPAPEPAEEPTDTAKPEGQ